LGPDNRTPAAVLLLNLGGPDSLDAVRPFLFNLFSDREIIRLGPAFMQKPIACMIAALRAGKTRDAYSLIGGRSPIRDITAAQAEALELKLKSVLPDMRVFVGMRYWRPYIKDVVCEMYRQGIRQIIVIGLYPHYSVATTGSSVSELKNVLCDYPDIRTFEILSWHDHPGYIDALAENIAEGIRASGMTEKDIHLLFSAHSLPVKFIDEGDPYVDHINGTIRAVTERFSIAWSLSYQSKSGPVKWLEPSTESMLETLASRGVKNLLVVPVSFVSDHIETLYEIDILYKNMAAELGIKLMRIESLNLSETFISALQDMAMKGIMEAGWKE
jgi:ferrochelatase